MIQLLPWLVLLGYAALILWITPRGAGPAQFFGGRSKRGRAPGVLLLGVSAAISWVMAKSVDNTMNLAAAFGVWGGIGYATYWLGFITAGVVIYFLRTRGGHRSMAEFFVNKYGRFAVKAFLIVIGIRLLNEVWSNTKVAAQFFGEEGSFSYWLAAAAVTAFTGFYSWRGGLRSSIMTDAMQMVLLALLLAVVLVALGPGLWQAGVPSVADGEVSDAMRLGGLTFFGLALVQCLSYPFHDPVLTDRAFVSSPGTMLRGFVVAALLGGGLIALFSVAGLYAIAQGINPEPSVAVAVPQVIGVWMLLVFNGIMLTGAGSTLDSTFASTAKFSARDWRARHGEADAKQLRIGRWAMVLIAVFGNLPLVTVHLGDQIGPAVIAATTISGTMVMGLAPILLLAWVRPAGPVAFHAALWPGLVIGALMAGREFFDGVAVPAWGHLGVGAYADDLGVNLIGLGICTGGFLVGTALEAAGLRLGRPVRQASVS